MLEVVQHARDQEPRIITFMVQKYIPIAELISRNMKENVGERNRSREGQYKADEGEILRSFYSLSDLLSLG